MTTKDAVAILLMRTWADSVDEQAESIVPIIERALRAAYCAGLDNTQIPDHPDAEVGVTAGVAAMMEGS